MKPKRIKVVILCLNLSFLSIFTACNKEDKEPIKSEVSDVNIGAYYFDGWSGKNTSSAPWAVNAPTHLTYRMLTEFPEREPIWGWRNDELEIMERQIDLAADNGIKFFAFCWYWADDNQAINIEKIKNDHHHTSLGLYLRAKNKHRVKFCLLVANHGGFEIKGSDNWKAATEFWMPYFKDPQHMKVDNEPLLIIFNTKGAGKNELAAVQKAAKDNGLSGVSITACSNGDVNAGYEYRTHYNIKPHQFNASKQREYFELMDAQKKEWWGSEKQPYIPVVTVGWDKRPWEDPTKESDWYYTGGRTPQRFKETVSDAIRWMDKNPKQTTKERIILLYAWNEYGEGGYLAPTKGDPNAEYLKAIGSLVKTDNR